MTNLIFKDGNGVLQNGKTNAGDGSSGNPFIVQNASQIVDSTSGVPAGVDSNGNLKTTNNGPGFTPHCSPNGQPAATQIKSGAGIAKNFYITNKGTSFAYVKLYDKIGEPTLGTDPPLKLLGIPPNGGGALNLGDGCKFSTGLVYKVVTGESPTDTTAPPANTVVINFDYV